MILRFILVAYILFMFSRVWAADNSLPAQSARAQEAAGNVQQYNGVGNGQNINQNAKNSAASQAVGMIGNAAVAAAMAPDCFKEPRNWYACAVMGASLLQASTMMGSQKGAKDAASASQNNAPASNPTTGTNAESQGAGVESSAAGIASAAKTVDKLKKELAAKGISVSPDGQKLNTPDGKSVPMSAFNSPAGLSALGLTPADKMKVDQLQKTVAEAAAKKMAGMSFESGGGGGSNAAAAGSNGTSAVGGEFDFNAFLKNMQQGNARQPTSVVGLSRKLGNDSIGISGDNIFDMINRQYKRKDNQNFFFRGDPRNERALPMPGQ